LAIEVIGFDCGIVGNSSAKASMERIKPRQEEEDDAIRFDKIEFRRKTRQIECN
jgi:hypothetical protein